MQSNASSSSKIFITAVVLSGLAVLTNAVLHPSSESLVRLVSFLLVAAVAARMKVKLPGLTGNMSVNLPFILVAAAELSAFEAILVACFSTLVQCIPRGPQKFNLVQALFNFCNMALAVGATRLVLAQPAINRVAGGHALTLTLAGAAFFVVNTAPVAVIIALTEAKNAVKTWGNIFQLSFPYFVLSAAIAALVLAASEEIGWQVPLLVLPIMFGVFKSYKRYFGGEVARAPLGAAKAAAV